MPIPYERKRQLLLEKKEQLFPALQKHISLRNVSAACKLPAPAQETLARALERGIKKQRRALEFLQREPDAGVEQLIAALEGEKEETEKHAEEAPSWNNESEVSDTEGSKRAGDTAVLADLLLEYGLYTNRLIAEAVASADYMAGVLEAVRALERVREPQGAQTETVTLALCAVAVRLIEQINDLLDENYAHRMAVLQAEVIAWGRFMQGDTFSFPRPGPEDTRELGEMIRAASELGHADAARAAEHESLADMLQLVCLYRRIVEARAGDTAVFTAVRIGFVLRVVNDFLLSLNGGNIIRLQASQSHLPDWLRDAIRGATQKNL